MDEVQKPSNSECMDFVENVKHYLIYYPEIVTQTSYAFTSGLWNVDYWNKDLQ
jgi:hypothetical protein